MKLEKIIRNFGGLLLASSLSIGCAVNSNAQKQELGQERRLKEILSSNEIKGSLRGEWRLYNKANNEEVSEELNDEFQTVKKQLEDSGYVILLDGNIVGRPVREDFISLSHYKDIPKKFISGIASPFTAVGSVSYYGFYVPWTEPEDWGGLGFSEYEAKRKLYGGPAPTGLGGDFVSGILGGTVVGVFSIVKGAYNLVTIPLPLPLADLSIEGQVTK